MGTLGLHCQERFQTAGQAFPHFRGRCLGEGHHQDFPEGCRRCLIGDLAEASVDQGACLTRAGTGNHQDVASCLNRLLLSRGVFHAWSDEDASFSEGV